MLCDDALRALVESRLRAFPMRAAPPGSGRAAAVAVAISDAGFGPDLDGLPQHATKHPGAALILTRRSLKLRNHAGQWALPGGRIDEGETPEETALREMREEIGLHLPLGDPNALWDLQ